MNIPFRCILNYTANFIFLITTLIQQNIYLIACKNYFLMVSNACVLNHLIVSVRFTRSQIWGHSAAMKEKTKDSHKGCQLCPWNYILLFDLFQLSQLARAHLKRKKENLKFPGRSLSLVVFCRDKWSCLCTFHYSFVKWFQKHLSSNIWINLLSVHQSQ